MFILVSRRDGKSSGSVKVLRLLCVPHVGESEGHEGRDGVSQVHDASRWSEADDYRVCHPKGVLTDLWIDSTGEDRVCRTGSHPNQQDTPGWTPPNAKG